MAAPRPIEAVHRPLDLPLRFPVAVYPGDLPLAEALDVATPPDARAAPLYTFECFEAGSGFERGGKRGQYLYALSADEGAEKVVRAWADRQDVLLRSVTGRAAGESAAEPSVELDSARGLVVQEVARVVPRTVEWLWPARIPLGKVTTLDGDPSLGKSTLTLDLAARVSCGLPMPDGAPGVGGAVLILSAEDDPGDTIRPRLEAARANLSRVSLVCALVGDDGERLPELPQDLAVIEAAAVRRSVRLIVVDPLMAYLAGAVNAHRDQDVRRALAPLKRVAETTGAAVLLVRHLNKRGGGNALYRGGGSIGIVAAARSGLLVAEDPDDPRRRVLATTKANLAVPGPSLSYRVVSAENGVAAIDWLGESAHTAAALLAAAGVEGPERSALDSARDLLVDLLSEGPCRVQEIKAEADRAGIGWRTVERAKHALGVVARRVGGVGSEGAWTWSLPLTPPTPPKGGLGGDRGETGAKRGRASPDPRTGGLSNRREVEL